MVSVVHSLLHKINTAILIAYSTAKKVSAKQHGQFDNRTKIVRLLLLTCSFPKRALLSWLVPPSFLGGFPVELYQNYLRSTKVVNEYSSNS